MTKIQMPEPVAYLYVHGEQSGVRLHKCSEMGLCAGTIEYKLVTTTQAEAYAEARVREVQQWQPIETAPKDGTRVILAWGGKSIGGFFLDNSRSQIPWAGWRTESMVPMPAGQPSHWMPLPSPPTK